VKEEARRAWRAALPRRLPPDDKVVIFDLFNARETVARDRVEVTIAPPPGEAGQAVRLNLGDSRQRDEEYTPRERLKSVDLIMPDRSRSRRNPRLEATPHTQAARAYNESVAELDGLPEAADKPALLERVRRRCAATPEMERAWRTEEGLKGCWKDLNDLIDAVRTCKGLFE
jgi:hypothetical protein